ncbi:MAG: hypothetical protein H6811_09295 [Phycisphaeraceae bacterium]|nr:hypothetical protein [Phycisphaeraceae bacterium]
MSAEVLRRVEVQIASKWARCDADLVHRAIVNLVRNGLEAMLEHGAAGVLVARAAPADGGEGIVFEVEDAGPGIPDGIRARMFNPFFTTRKSGTGLGLAIVHRIAEAHGGRVEVVSPCRDGRGTLVRLVLPRGATDGPDAVEIVVPPRTRRERAA